MCMCVCVCACVCECVCVCVCVRVCVYEELMDGMTQIRVNGFPKRFAYPYAMTCNVCKAERFSSTNTSIGALYDNDNG